MGPHSADHHDGPGAEQADGTADFGGDPRASAGRAATLPWAACL
jgi:hypothetical protein